jgi:DNA-binding NarL/FixJ family response regulator
MDRKIRIMLIEDHASYRAAIIAILEQANNMEVHSQFGTAEIALRSLQPPITAPLPDVILLDLNLPGMSGLETIPWIRKYTPDVQIIILTRSDNTADIQRAISEGADGYLLKSATLEEITEGIETVANGGSSLDPDVARYILNTIRRKSIQTEPEKTLSTREMEILELLGEGLVKKEIADRLNISPPSVATYVRRIYEKLEVQNAASAINKAYRYGILPSDNDEL